MYDRDPARSWKKKRKYLPDPAEPKKANKRQRPRTLLQRKGDDVPRTQGWRENDNKYYEERGLAAPTTKRDKLRRA